MNPRARRVLPTLALAGILAVYVALFLQTRRFDFVWADADAIRDSAVFRLPLGRALRTSEHERMTPALLELRGIALTHEAYRPLVILSHAVDLRIFGREPGPMHLTALLLGALAILAAFALALRLFDAPVPALVVAAIFAWHPLQVEAIAFLSARADPLAAIFALVAALFVVRARPIAGPLGAGVAFLLSLFTKEANALLPLALAAFALATGQLRAWRRGLVALVAALPLYALLRALLVPHAPAATHADRLVHAAVTLPAVALEYARSFVLPFDLSISRPLYLGAAVGWIALAAVSAALALALRRAAPTTRPAVALAAAGLAWAGALLAPSAVAVYSEGAVADRYVYLPLFGFAVAVVALGARLAAVSARARVAVAVAAAAWLALLVFVTSREIPAWADSATLYAHAVDVQPYSAAAHNRLGRYYAEQHLWPAAVAELEHAAALPDAGDHVLNNLGVAYLAVGRPSDAAAVLRRAVERSHQTSYHAWYNLGTALRAQGELPAACAAYRRALALSPAYDHARADLARYCPTASPTVAPPDAVAPTAP